MNELFGANLTTPWTVTNARYRENVLQWARLLAAKGARPALLLSTDPYTGGDAAQWWRDIAQVSDLVLEKYFSAAAVSRAGPCSGTGACARRYGARRRSSSRSTSLRPVSASCWPSRRAAAPAGARASSPRRDGSKWPSGRRWPPGRWRRSSGSRTSGRGAGARTTATARMRTSPVPRAPGCGRATGRSATRRRPSARRSRPICARARSTFRPACAAPTGTRS